MKERSIEHCWHIKYSQQFPETLVNAFRPKLRKERISGLLNVSSHWSRARHVVVAFVGMEPKNPTMLESSGEDAMLIETVKSIVTQRERNESETEDDFFLVSQNQAEQYSGENIEEMTPHKHETKEILAWIHLCRTCANTCDNLIPIFEGEGAEHDLPSKILKYLPIHVCSI